LFVFSLLLFILALEMVKAGASSLSALLRLEEWASTGSVGALGLGWLLACLFFSGSPVAALALVFLVDGALSPQASLSMVMGSRVGASFVVLAVGFLYDSRSDHPKGGTYVGALAFLSTASVYLPAWAIAQWLVGSAWLDTSTVEFSGGLVSVFDALLRYPLALVSNLSAGPQAFLGIALLLCAFKLFDVALPTVDPTGGKLGRMATTIYRPSIAFLLGMIVTAITLSVSVSLTLLVPLTVRGIVRRENLIPFILGANITTFMDTVVGSLVLGPAAFNVVLAAVLVVSAISVPIVLFFYRPYERLIDSLATEVTKTGFRLLLFVVSLFVVPTLLLVAQLLS